MRLGTVTDVVRAIERIEGSLPLDSGIDPKRTIMDRLEKMDHYDREGLADQLEELYKEKARLKDELAAIEFDV